MIQITVFCDTCKSSVSVVTKANRLAAVANGFNDLHGPLCFIEKEDPHGQDQGQSGEGITPEAAEALLATANSEKRH